MKIQHPRQVAALDPLPTSRSPRQLIRDAPTFGERDPFLRVVLILCTGPVEHEAGGRREDLCRDAGRVLHPLKTSLLSGSQF